MAWRSSGRGGHARTGMRRASSGSCGRSAGGARGWGAADEDRRRGWLAGAPASKENGRTPVLAGTGRRRSESGGRGARSGIQGTSNVGGDRSARRRTPVHGNRTERGLRERIERKEKNEGRGGRSSGWLLGVPGTWLVGRRRGCGAPGEHLLGRGSRKLARLGIEPPARSGGGHDDGSKGGGGGFWTEEDGGCGWLVR